jgi:hypothetical protein
VLSTIQYSVHRELIQKKVNDGLIKTWDELKADVGGAEAPSAEAYAAAGCPSWATPIPARVFDAARFSTTLREVVRQTSAGREDFLQDHHIDGALAFLRRLGQALLRG